eukprot:Gb_37559 [translate_table: standard]
MSFFFSFIIDAMIISYFISSFLPCTWMAIGPMVLDFPSCLISASFT